MQILPINLDKLWTVQIKVYAISFNFFQYIAKDMGGTDLIKHRLAKTK